MAHVVLFALYPARGGIFNRLAGETDVGRWKWIYVCNNPNDYASLTVLVIGSAVALLLLFWEHRLLRLALTLTLIVLLTADRGAGRSRAALPSELQQDWQFSHSMRRLGYAR